MNVYQRTRKLPDGAIVTDACYTIRLEFRGQNITRKTKFTSKAEAEKYARQFRLALERGRFNDAFAQAVLDDTKLHPSDRTSPLRELTAAYDRLAASIKPRTRANNILALENLITAAAGVTREQAQAAQLGAIFHDDLIHRWKKTVDHRAADAAKAAADAGHDPDLRAQQIRRSANSQLRQARSLFTPRLLAAYRREKLVLPALDDFRAEPGFERTGKTDYFPPSDHILARTFASLEAMGLYALGLTPDSGTVITDRTTALNIFRAVWLALGFGLRKSEIARARWSWLITRAGHTWLAAEAITKNGRPVEIPSLAPAAQMLLATRPAALTTPDYILDGTPTERTEETFRLISRWMRAIGWQTEKTIHEFRAWSGCQIAMGDPSAGRGLIAARDWLRHASTQTTERNYGRYIRTRAAAITLEFPTATPALQILPHP